MLWSPQLHQNSKKFSGSTLKNLKRIHSYVLIQQQQNIRNACDKTLCCILAPALSN